MHRVVTQPKEVTPEKIVYIYEEYYILADGAYGGMGTTLTNEAVQQYQQQQGFQVKSDPEHGKLLRKGIDIIYVIIDCDL